MKQVLIRKGRVFAADVPAPQVEPGTVRVRTRVSCISPGTEKMGIESSAKSLLERGLAQPDKALKAVREMRRVGVAAVLRRARDRFDAELPTGYSAAGVVSEVGESVSDVRVGDRVAVAGAAYAMHAAELVVPRNLLVKMPDGVSFEQGSTVALGAIAMQGVRRAQPALGECVVVLGCGALGLLTIQMLRAAGCRVAAIDLNPARLALAARLGAEWVLQPGEQDIVRVMRHATDGHGADAVLLTAATSSNEPLRQAFEMCRRRGRVVLVGVTGREFDRDAMYARELDLVISTSYGPGRYDDQYERWGLDYPYAYVRWTENRNMEAYLRLLAGGAVGLDGLIGGRYPVDQADQAYAALAEQGAALALIEYPEPAGVPPAAREAEPAGPAPAAGPHPAGTPLRLALIGAGSFVRAVHVPNLLALPSQYRVAAVISRSGVSARTVAAGFEGCRAEADLSSLLSSRQIDGVLIGTRHHLHAGQAIEAIRKGKAVLVEKPMCLTEAECAELKASLAQANGVFMVGYNRRFAPLVAEIRKRLKGRVNPVMIHYTMNAGYLPYDHWTQTAEGGGRLMGEACHVFDLFRSLVGAPVRTLSLDAVRPQTGSVRPADNCVVTVTYEDGSVATLLYTAVGHPDFQKERMEVFCDEQTLVLDDYSALHEYGREQRSRRTRQDKGHLAELKAFHRAWIDGVRFPIPWEELEETWAITWQVSRAIDSGR